MSSTVDAQSNANENGNDEKQFHLGKRSTDTLINNNAENGQSNKRREVSTSNAQSTPPSSAGTSNVGSLANNRSNMASYASMGIPGMHPQAWGMSHGVQYGYPMGYPISSQPHLSGMDMTYAAQFGINPNALQHMQARMGVPVPLSVGMHGPGGPGGPGTTTTFANPATMTWQQHPHLAAFPGMMHNRPPVGDLNLQAMAASASAATAAPVASTQCMSTSAGNAPHVHVNDFSVGNATKMKVFGDQNNRIAGSESQSKQQERTARSRTVQGESDRSLGDGNRRTNTSNGYSEEEAHLNNDDDDTVSNAQDDLSVSNMDDAELRVRRTRRGVYKSRRGSEAATEQPRPSGRRKRRGNGRGSGRGRGIRQVARAQLRKVLQPRKVVFDDIAVVFDLSNEPCLKYNIVQVLDPGTDYTDWTSYKLKERTIYMETITQRYEITREAALNEHGFDQYRISRVKDAQKLSIDKICDLQVPLPESELEVLHRHVDWNELKWSTDGIQIRGKKLTLLCLRFCLNITPVKKELLRQSDDIALREAFSHCFGADVKPDDLKTFPAFMSVFSSLE